MYDETRLYYDQMGYGNEVLERFWSKVDVKKLEDGADDLDACMEWTAGCYPNGYGCFHYKKSHVAHRFIYECFNGPIPKRLPELKIRHACDNHPCVNPRHLLIGTSQENSDDMVSRNRQTKGIDIHTSILTEEQALDVKYLLERNTPIKMIANKYDVGIHTIYKIRSGQNWSWLTGIKEGDYFSYLIKDHVLEIKQLLNNMPIRLIAKRFNIGTKAIYDIRNGKSWSKITGIKRK